MEGLRRLSGQAEGAGQLRFSLTVLAHGTTVATNALLERAGARVALICNEGMEDLIEIGRQHRPALYDPAVRRPDPLVDRLDRLAVPGRIDAQGHVIEELGEVPDVDASVDAVAVSLLHADLNADHERRVHASLSARGRDVTVSSAIAPQFREYERTSTAVLNAYLRPRCRPYLEGLGQAVGRLSVMTSAGGLIPGSVAADVPVTLLLSGPAGGVRAATDVAAANGFGNAIAFDMGGTSTDVCLIQEGEPAPAALREIEGFPVLLPALDILTIGAGGGSIARIDPGGALVVGPRSAGARPGPACYGHGGREPTVTDANLVAGRIDPVSSFPGIGRLDVEAATAALASAGVDAAGVLDVVNANMERALRAVTVERGVDPTTLALVAFGGAGPLHACDLADAMGIGTVLVPARAGVLSAVGLLCSPMRRDLVRSWPFPLDHAGIADALRELRAEAEDLVGEPTSSATSLDCRYPGQSHEITVDAIDGFHEAHHRLNGFSTPESHVEVVTLRASAQREAPVALSDLPVPDRAPAAGPTVISEPDCTIWLPRGWIATVGEAGALVLRRP